MAFGDLFQLRALWIEPASQLTAENSFYFRQDGDLVFDTPQEDLVESFKFYAEAAYMNVVHSNYGINRYTVYDMPEKLLSFVSIEGDRAAALTGDQLPPSISVVLNYRSATLGRRGKGRLFLGPINETNNLAVGKPTGGIQTAAEAFGDALMDMVTTSISYAPWTWGVWSVEDQAFRPVVGHDASTIWGNINSRKR